MKAIEKALERMIEKTLGETEPECSAEPSTHPVTPGCYIAVLDRGWVYVGNCRINGDWLEITDAKNIRRWGTTKGLGELRSGPTTETKWDQAGEVKAPVKSLITLISCLPNHNW